MQIPNRAILLALWALAAMLPWDSWSSPVATTTIAGQSTALLISASVGPLHYLSGAQVVVRDAKGKVVGRQTTNIKGSAVIRLPSTNSTKLPLTIKTVGGRVVYQYDDPMKAPRFFGHLLGKVSVFRENHSTLVYLDLVSTVASRLTSEGTTYEDAVRKTRDALGIVNLMPLSVLRYTNDYVHWNVVQSTLSKRQGYDTFTKSLARKVGNGRDLTYLGLRDEPTQPSSTHRVSSMADRPSAQTLRQTNTGAASTSSVYSPCDAPVGNSGGGGGSSTENIVNVGVQATQTLLSLAGKKGAAEGVGMVAGMLLQGGSSGSSATTDAIEAVSQQLFCISQQIVYLTQQVNQLQLAEAVSSATDCSNTIQAEYDTYEGYVYAAEPRVINGETYPGEPLDSTNADFVNDLQGWGDEMKTCALKINNMLWGVNPGTIPAWNQLNSNYRNSYDWYTQGQVQELQEFLAFYSMRIHEAFILQNEKYNYNQEFADAIIAAGSDNWSPTLCKNNRTASYVTSQDQTYCVWQNNILAAYPGDLYSDEAGIPDNGLSVNVMPGAKSLPVSGSPWPTLDTKYLYQFPARAPEQPGAAYPYDDIALQYWTAPIIDPVSEPGSAIETFTYPRVPHSSAYKSQVDILNQPGPPGPWTANASSTASEFFLYQVNQSPSSPWKTLGSDYLSFYSREDVSVITSKLISSYPPTPQYYDEYMELHSAVATKPKYKAGKSCRGGSPFACTDYDPIYYMGILQQRTWWPGAPTATSYKPSCPPQNPMPPASECS
jgi:hypothetical protein